MLIRRADEVVPVEYKSGKGPLWANQRAQLGALALLAEELTGLPARRGFVYWLGKRQAEEAPITMALRAQVRRELEQLRAMLARALLPEPTDHQGRCIDCEFRRFCGDIE